MGLPVPTQVPDVPMARGRCRVGWETVKHLMCHDPKKREQRQALEARAGGPLRTRQDLDSALDSPQLAGLVVHWLLDTGQLQEFRLAVQPAIKDSS
jgi:hypothetical protein